MKRRNLFRLLACAAAASAMDVMGLVPVKAPGIPRLKFHATTLWQKGFYMNGGDVKMAYCLSDKHPEALTPEEFGQAMEEGNRMACLEAAYTNVDSVVMERRLDPLPIWEDIIPPPKFPSYEA